MSRSLFQRKEVLASLEHGGVSEMDAAAFGKFSVGFSGDRGGR